VRQINVFSKAGVSKPRGACYPPRWV